MSSFACASDRGKKSSSSLPKKAMKAGVTGTFNYLRSTKSSRRQEKENLTNAVAAKKTLLMGKASAVRVRAVGNGTKKSLSDGGKSTTKPKPFKFATTGRAIRARKNKETMSKEVEEIRQQLFEETMGAIRISQTTPSKPPVYVGTHTTHASGVQKGKDVVQETPISRSGLMTTPSRTPVMERRSARKNSGQSIFSGAVRLDRNGQRVRSARKKLLPAATAGVDAEANLDTVSGLKETMTKPHIPMKSAEKAQALVNHILKSTVKRVDKMDLKTASGRTRVLSKMMPRVEEAAQTPIRSELIDMSVALNAAARTPSSSISSGNDVNVEDLGDDSELTHIFINSPKQMSRKSPLSEDGVNGSSPFRFDVSSQTTPSSKDQSAFRCASPMPAHPVEPRNRRESLVSDPVARTLSAEKDFTHAVGDDERQSDILGLRAPQPFELTDRPNDTSPRVVCKYATACC